MFVGVKTTESPKLLHGVASHFPRKKKRKKTTKRYFGQCLPGDDSRLFSVGLGTPHRAALDLENDGVCLAWILEEDVVAVVPIVGMADDASN